MTVAFADLTPERVQTNGVELAVHRVGDGPVVVLLHGWCGAAYHWRRLVPLLVAEGYRCLVPDQRGCGDSEKPDSTPDADGGAQGGYDAVSMAEDVVGLLDHDGAERAFVIGHDMGAPVALAFGATHADRALGVAYIDEPLVGHNHTEMTAFSPEASGGFWQFGLNWIPGLPELLYAGHEEEFLRFILQAMTAAGEPPEEEAVQAYARGMLQPGGLSGWVGWYRAVPETAAQLRRLAIDAEYPTPVLGIGGERGVAVTHEQLRVVRDDAAGTTLPDCGHLPAEEQPEALMDALRAFLGAHAERRP